MYQQFQTLCCQVKSHQLTKPKNHNLSLDSARLGLTPQRNNLTRGRMMRPSAAALRHENSRRDMMRPYASAPRSNATLHLGVATRRDFSPWCRRRGAGALSPKLRLGINLLCHQAYGGKGHISATTPTPSMTICSRIPPFYACRHRWHHHRIRPLRPRLSKQQLHNRLHT